jgi:hypothetical protein
MFKPATQLDPTKPEPGLYVGVSRSVYYQPWACNHSTLRHMADSPAHCAASRREASQHTEATRWGTAFHAWAFDRENFENEVHIVPVTSHAAKKKYEEEHPAIGAAIDASELNEIREASKSIGAHPDARRWRSLEGPREVTMVWNDPSGVLCRARFDKVCLVESAGTAQPVAWADVKTTRSVQPEDFEKSLYDFGYHSQNAFYRRGWNVLGLPDVRSVIIAIENTPPYSVATFEIDDDTKAIADGIVNAWLIEWAECEKSGKWPRRVADAPTPIGLPGWVKKRYKEFAL